MLDFQEAFIRYAIQCEVLRFGDFTLKSGRRSPYFFNTGLFDNGARLGQLGEFFAAAIQHYGIRADVLFGPAYKGIPLVSATSIALARRSGVDVPFAFNRKEAKDHGEGGVVVGSALRGDVLILDDVITAGTSVNESMTLINACGARCCGVLIALDREERGSDTRSAVAEVSERYVVPVYSIIRLRDIVSYLDATGHVHEVNAVRRYQAEFG